MEVRKISGGTSTRAGKGWDSWHLAGLVACSSFLDCSDLEEHLAQLYTFWCPYVSCVYHYVDRNC